MSDSLDLVVTVQAGPPAPPPVLQLTLDSTETSVEARVGQDIDPIDVSQTEAEAGTATITRGWSALRVRQAINGWWQSVFSPLGRNLATADNEGEARDLLQLGNAATRDVGSTPNTVASGTDARIVNAVQSAIAGITGADQISNIVSLNRLEYNALAVPRNPSTFYVITRTDPLYEAAGQLPAFDLRFDRGTIVDVIGGITPTFTRPSSTKLAWNGSQFVEYPANVPAFQVDPLTGRWGCLLEPGSSNLVQFSYQPITGSWSVASNIYEEGIGLALNGSAQLWRSTANAGTALKRIRNNLNTTTTGAYCSSWFIKAASEQFVTITVQDQTGGNGFNSGRFDTITGSFANAGYQFGTGTYASRGVIPYGNEWYRIWVSGTLTTALTQVQNILHHDVAGTTASTGIIEGWISQIETGPIPTSPITTAGSAVTRAADTMTFGPGETFDSWYDINGMTLVAQYSAGLPPAGTNYGAWGITNGSFGRGWGTASIAPSTSRLEYRDSTTNASIQTVSSLVNGLNQVATFASPTTRSISTNGIGAVETNSTLLVLSPAVDRLNIGRQDITGSILQGPITLHRFTAFASSGPASSRLLRLSAAGF